MEQQNINIEEIFQDIIESDISNKKCFDCDSPSPQWVSVNNGIFICINCSGIHRSLGIQISQVRSVKFDIWQNHQIELIRKGGNNKLSEFFDQFDLNSKDISEKFKTNAAAFYRRRLVALATASEFTELQPEFNIGRQLVDETQENKVQDDNKEWQDSQQEEDLQDWTGFLKKRANTIMTTVKSGAQTTYQKTQEMQIMQKTQSGVSNTIQMAGSGVQSTLNRAGTMTKETGQNLKQKMDDYGVTQVASETANKLSFGAKMMGGFLYSKAKDAGNMINQQIDGNENMKSTKDATKEKLNAFSGIVSSGWSSFYSKIGYSSNQQETQQDIQEVKKDEEEKKEDDIQDNKM